jgi:hypothetical protein
LYSKYSTQNIQRGSNIVDLTIKPKGISA